MVGCLSKKYPQKLQQSKTYEILANVFLSRSEDGVFFCPLHHLHEMIHVFQSFGVTRIFTYKLKVAQLYAIPSFLRLGAGDEQHRGSSLLLYEFLFLSSQVFVQLQSQQHILSRM